MFQIQADQIGEDGIGATSSAHKGDRKNLSRASVGKPEGEKLLSSLGCRWEKVLKLIKVEVGRILLKGAS
jgi:hypothetical protein